MSRNRRRGGWIDVDGEPVHVLGDLDKIENDPESRAAIENVLRAAKEQFRMMDTPHMFEPRLDFPQICERCGYPRDRKVHD